MPVCPKCDVAYMESESHSCEPRRRWGGTSAREDAPRGTVSAAQAPQALAGRYRDGYQVAAFLVWFGNIVKVVGVAVGVIAVLGAVASLSGGGPPTGAPGLGSFGSSGLIGLGVLLFGGLVGLSIFSLGVLVSAQGQLVMATLDNAVNSSHFLTNEQRASIIF